MKLALQKITHKKIVQKIFSSHIQASKIIVGSLDNLNSIEPSKYAKNI